MRIAQPRFEGLRLLLKGPVQTAHPVTLTHKRIFILPTGLGLIFGLMVLAMLGISINYANNLGYALSFVCMSTGLVSMLHTHRNLSGLHIAPGKCQPVFAGQSALFHLLIQEDQGRPRSGIRITGPETSQTIDLPSRKAGQACVQQTTHSRGLVSFQEARISTVFPLGLFQAWSKVRPQMTCLVYPRPATSGQASEAISAQSMNSVPNHHPSQPGVEDFSGLAEYLPGASAKRIDWKAYARGQGLMVREFADPPAKGVIFDYNDLPEALMPEERLSILCRLILDAHDSGLAYGLRLPGTDVPVGQGIKHEEKCLKALALYDFSKNAFMD